MDWIERAALAVQEWRVNANGWLIEQWHWLFQSPLTVVGLLATSIALASLIVSDYNRRMAKQSVEQLRAAADERYWEQRCVTLHLYFDFFDTLTYFIDYFYKVHAERPKTIEERGEVDRMRRLIRKIDEQYTIDRMINWRSTARFAVMLNTIELGAQSYNDQIARIERSGWSTERKQAETRRVFDETRRALELMVTVLARERDSIQTYLAGFLAQAPANLALVEALRMRDQQLTDWFANRGAG